MAQDQGEVVIVDASGTEHVFPAGFDPQKAASIVRETTKPKTGEPGFVLPGGPSAAMAAGAKGFVKEALPAVGKAIVGLPSAVLSLVKELGSTAEGAANLVSDPEGTLSIAWESIKDIPGKAKDAVKSALDLAKKDPEAFGKAVADATGQAEVGILASKAIPLAPKPAARVLGNVMEQVGSKGQWPIRMMGAHQLGSGNPMGIATMMVPEGLKKGGAALTEFGREGPALVPTNPKLASYRENVTSGVNKAVAGVPNPAREGLADIDAAIAENKKAAAGVRSAAAKAEGSATKAEQRADLAQSKVEAPAETYTPQEREMLRRAGGITDSPSKGAIPVSTIPTKVPGTVIPAPTAAPKGISIAGLETTPAPKGGPIVVPANESNEAFKARMLAKAATEKPTVAAVPKPIKGAPLKQNAATAENNYGITNPPRDPHTADVNRVLSPKEAGYQANIDQGNLALSRSRGLANSMRGPVADQIQQLIDRGASPLEIEAYKRRQGIL